MAVRSAPLYGALDVLVETRAGEPVTFLADTVRDDGRVFSHAAAHPNDFWWEVSLSWMLATGLLARFEQALAAAIPEIDTLKYGERATHAAAKPGKKPAADKKPTAAKPAPKKPAAKASKQPTKKPAAKKPAAKKPAAKKPAARPVAKKPVAKKPAKKPAKMKPAQLKTKPKKKR
jgi:outer membrane biosynthesis protein TonB